MLSALVPRRPILGTRHNHFERHDSCVWYNRSAVVTCYGNQFSFTCSIDIGTKNRHSSSMIPSTPHTTLASSLDQFTRELDKSPLTIQAYRTDIQQFLTWLAEHDITVTGAQQVKRSHINEYLRYLA